MVPGGKCHKRAEAQAWVFGLPEVLESTHESTMAKSKTGCYAERGAGNSLLCYY